jgi:hypothetical protein
MQAKGDKMPIQKPSLAPVLPADIETHIGTALQSGLAQGVGTAVLFFRADDIGVPSLRFFQMIRLFSEYKVPLCLAVVPSWLTSRRLQQLQDATGTSTRYCWHQHGWRHKNHEPSGKKQEFGESRSVDQIRRDIIRGETRLRQLLGNSFFPCFTPPWNRCGSTTLKLLADRGYLGVSRSSGATPSCPPELRDIQINVDLHTRKESSGDIALANLLKELQSSVAYGTSGIMLHHQRMNDQALFFLEILLHAVSQFSSITPVHFEDMLKV